MIVNKWFLMSKYLVVFLFNTINHIVCKLDGEVLKCFITKQMFNKKVLALVPKFLNVICRDSMGGIILNDS